EVAFAGPRQVATSGLISTETSTYAPSSAPTNPRIAMPTTQSQLEHAFRTAIRDAFGLDADPILTVSQNEKFGDYQSNAAMGLAKQLGKNPRQVAEQIKSHLNVGEIASDVSIAGPGFINIRLSPQWIAKQLTAEDAKQSL